MASKKKCRICGKEYEYCHTNRTVSGVFRWQDVACSVECGSVYLSKILESRKEKEPEVESAVETVPETETFAEENNSEKKTEKKHPKYKRVFEVDSDNGDL